ncbi:hypothetical protein ACQP2U_08395 [Nocardia sp. CA-084685]|uniref:hypothetical protein n=1 Tax=Nocardia sp. CA-084685 TaxID=3239970 RepID=UPI003D954608
MGSGDQIGMDFDDVDLTPVETPAPPGPPEWVRWFRQMDARLTTFTTETIPGLPQPIWSEPAMDRIEAVFFDFLPDEASVTDPANADIADQFVRWTGECFVRASGWQWCTVPDARARGGLYRDFGPAVRGYDDDPDPLFIVPLLKAATHNDFGEIRYRFGG